MPITCTLRARSLLVLAALAMHGSPAQEAQSPRARMTGWVADSAGKRVPNAEVHLLSWPMPPRTDVGKVDHLQITTDAQGFFHAELLHGRGYSGFAFWRSGEQSHRTAVTEDLIPGPPRGLEECAAQTLERVRVQGAAQWQSRGPLQLLLFTSGRNPRRIELKTDAEMIAPLPPLPGGYLSFEVRAADGQLLGLVLDHRQGAETELVIDLAPPKPVTVTAVDEAGALIAGAVVYLANKYTYGSYHPRLVPDRLGVTDASGTLTVQLPARAPSRDETKTDFILIVEAEGRARVPTTVDVAVAEKARVVMPAAPQLCGRLLDALGKPAAGVTLLPESFGLARDIATGAIMIHPRPLPTGADGTFRFDGLHPNHGFRLLAAIDPARARELGMQIRADFALAPVLWLAVGEPLFPPRLDLGDLRLDRLTFARIEVRKHDQQPAPGALLHVSGGGSYNSPLAYVTDRLGRLQFPLPKGEVTIGAYLKGGGVARAVVRIPADHDDPTIDPLLMQLTPPVSITGTVIDQDGKPVAGARVHFWNRPTGDQEFADLAFLSHAPSAPTGADGAFEVFLPYGAVKQDLRAVAPGSTGSIVKVEIDAEQRQVTGVRVPIDTRK